MKTFKELVNEATNWHDFEGQSSRYVPGEACKHCGKGSNAYAHQSLGVLPKHDPLAAPGVCLHGQCAKKAVKGSDRCRDHEDILSKQYASGEKKLSITELKSVHDSYGRWGHMDREGKLVSGNDHPTAQMHGDGDGLRGHAVAWAQEHPRKEHDSSWGNNTNWEPSARPKLNIRTNGQEGLATAIKHFERFPHAAGRDVDWDHYGKVSGKKNSNTGHFGEKTKIHNLMKAHYEEHYGPLPE